MHQIDDFNRTFTRTYRTLNPDPVNGPNTQVLCHPDSNACLDAWRGTKISRLRKFLRGKSGGCGCG